MLHVRQLGRDGGDKDRLCGGMFVIFKSVSIFGVLHLWTGTRGSELVFMVIWVVSRW